MKTVSAMTMVLAVLTITSGCASPKKKPMSNTEYERVMQRQNEEQFQRQLNQF
ncbi:MAG: hypothetical protein ACFCUX_04130 [Candidatus Methylacidiphilales bacterium]